MTFVKAVSQLKIVLVFLTADLSHTRELNVENSIKHVQSSCRQFQPMREGLC